MMMSHNAIIIRYDSVEPNIQTTELLAAGVHAFVTAQNVDAS